MTIALPRGVLLALEGIDGAGKTTQASLLAQALRMAGLDVVRTKEPTDGPWGRKLRASASNGRMSAEDELEAFVADRKEHVEQVIRPALAAGKVVIIDRYYFSTAAYQGARGLDPAQILRRNEEFAPRPDLLVVLDVPPETGLRRIHARGGEANLFENREALDKARQVFLSMRDDGLKIIDGSLEIEKITSIILHALRMGPLFDRMCWKRKDVTQCEPGYCGFRLSGTCKWVELGSQFGYQTSPNQSEFMSEAQRIAHDNDLSPAEKVDEVLRILPILEKA